MRGVHVPVLHDIHAQEGGKRIWRRGGLVDCPDGRRVLVWDGVSEKDSYRRAWAYTEYQGKPLFCAEGEEGLLIRYGDELHPAGEELYGPPGIVHGQVFYLSRFSDGWELAWNGFGQPLCGNHLIFPSLEITPFSKEDGFDVSYESEVDGGVIAVFNDKRSKVFDAIALRTLYKGELLACGSFAGKWYVEYSGTGLAIHNWMLNIEFDDETGILSYRTSLESSHRTTINVTA